ncbi:MAG: amino acid permease [Desulfobulbus sp.]|nr:MAG: amino acid permease [Desulfobulbus sp.]
MRNKQLGPLLLSGLMIGPILGSGIIIIPPLVYQVTGDWAFLAWLLIIGISFFFATIFARLSILFPGKAGVANAIEHAFGKRIKLVSSFYLTGAVLFGPVAVLLTAAQYLQSGSALPPALLALLPLIICTGMLLLQVTSIGRISLCISSIVAVILFAGATSVLLFHHKSGVHLPPFSGPDFGYGLLLLFWTVVGWEVVGNYSGDVRDPEKTIPRAVTFSVSIMALVSLTVAGAVQMIANDRIAEKTVTITDIIQPVFGAASDIIMALLVTSLCVTSYLLFTGGVARLIASLAETQNLPTFFAAQSKNGAPAAAILFLASVHLLVLIAVYFKLADIEQLVALADGFFIANALTGILSAVKLLDSWVLKTAAVVLAFIFSGILLQAALPVIGIIICLALFFFVRYPGEQQEESR